MSLLCGKNVIQARKYNNYMRNIVRSRDEELFQSEAGQDMRMTQEDAYTEGCELGWYFMPEIPVMPTDCIRPFELGVGLSREIEKERPEESPFYDDGYYDWLEKQAEREWDMETSVTSIYKAWMEAEYERIDQIESLWEEHEEPPLILTRVKEAAELRATW